MVRYLYLRIAMGSYVLAIMLQDGRKKNRLKIVEINNAFTKEKK